MAKLYTGAPGPSIDKASTERNVAKWLALLIRDSQAIEIRAPHARLDGRQTPRNIVKRFPAGAFAEAAREALRLSGQAPAVYLVMNGIKPELVNGPTGKGATVGDIPRRVNLLLDFDPVRPANTSSTDAEKADARAVMLPVKKYLKARGWPDPIVADSGNGYHLVYPIDLPADDRIEPGPDGKEVKTDGPSTLLIKSLINALADRFDTAGCKIDRKVFDAPRLVKLYGTESRKGEATAERPHRFARVLKVPTGDVGPVPVELLKALAASAIAEAPKVPAPRASGGRAVPPPIPPDIEARALKYLAKCEPAIQGADGSGRCYKAACKMVEMGLEYDTALHFLMTHYNPTCSPEWSEKEMRHKLDDAYKTAEKGKLLGVPRRNGTAPPPTTNGRGGEHPPATPPGNGRMTATPPPSVPPGDSQEGRNGDGRPAIIISTEEHAVISAAIEALSTEPAVFQRGNALVTVLRDSSRVKKHSIHRSNGSPRIVPLPLPRLRELLTKTAAWKRHAIRNHDVQELPAHPPDWAVNGVAARGHWETIRPLETVIETPTIRPDGTIVDKPGWDEATELLYEPNEDFPPIPDRPTREDAKHEAEFLLELVCDFPFKSDGHRAAWLAALLTPMARFAITGRCPLFLFDANTSGTGKSILTDVISLICTGREMARTTYSESEDEMRKRITSIALAGDRLMLIDNIASTFGGASIDSAITAPSWQDRKLGASEMTAQLPMFVVWYATGNNVELKGDMIRRVVPCRLETKEENPEERADFKIQGDLLDHVRKLRPKLVVAALTLLRAHDVAKRPAGGLTPLGSFTHWSAVVRSAVYWATGSDPLEPRKELRDQDTESIARAALIEGWSELPFAETGMTVATVLKLLTEHPDKFNKLRECLMEWSRNGELPGPRSIGMRLRRLKCRVINGKTFQAVPDGSGTQVWKIVKN